VNHRRRTKPSENSVLKTISQPGERRDYTKPHRENIGFAGNLIFLRTVFGKIALKMRNGEVKSPFRSKEDKMKKKQKVRQTSERI
jgi:hypothetical protein